MFKIKIYKMSDKMPTKNKHLDTTFFFDDEERGIVSEPFVSGASECIQLHLDRLGLNYLNVEIAFSPEPVKDADIVLECTEKCYPQKLNLKKQFGNLLSFHHTNMEQFYEEDKTKEPTSAWYEDQFGNVLWLCPAQLKFFGTVADKIFVKFINQ